MNRFKAVTAAMLFAALILAGPAWSQALDPKDIGKAGRPLSELREAGVPELRRIAGQAYAEKDLPTFRNALVALHEKRPNNSEYMYQLVLAHALMDEKRLAYNIMLQMQRQGLSYDFNDTEDSANIRGTDIYNHLNDLMVEAGKPFGTADSRFELPDEVRLAAAVAWDDSRQALIVGTAHQGLILAVGSDGETRELFRAGPDNGAWAIQGIGIDGDANRLYASTAATPQFSGFQSADQGRSMLLEFQLDTMELLDRYPVPVDGRPHSLAAVTVGAGGRVFAADSLLPIVYERDGENQRMAPFFSAPHLVNLRDLTLSPDGRLLYLADYEMGITVVEVSSRRSMLLQIPDSLNLGGIDGLATWRNDLVIIQNGLRPERVMRLILDESGTQVTNVAPVAVALELFDAPTGGAVVGDLLYFFANARAAAVEGEAVVIAEANLTNTPTLVDPQIEKLVEQFRRAQAEGRVQSMDSESESEVKPEAPARNEEEKPDKP
ncbi:MAG: hypothetical protein R3348_00120 [Xanthomonadales bacterium]|nr:hypothetical protein [Xanthomonadales bacterium]